MSLELARRDFIRYTQRKGWGTDVTFSPTFGGVGTVVTCLASKIGISIGEDGLPVNEKNAHITVSEQALTDAGYTVRNGNGEVDMINHFVSYTDSSGNTHNYQINTTMPDETLGGIYCVLGDYNNV